MSKPAKAHPEETLDPEDWVAMRALGHRMVDDMMDYIETIRDRPVWLHAPPEVKSHFESPPPPDPEPPGDIYEEYLSYILPAWLISAPRRGAGSMSTVRLVPGQPSLPGTGTSLPGWNGRIRWPLTCISGCTWHTPSAVSS